MELTLSNSNGVATMTSLQLVDYINYLRKQENTLDYTELRHSHFIDKIKTVLKGGEPNFRSSYKSAQNKDVLMYSFPKREAMLMAMSYSYDIQATVYDAWEAAEKKLNGVLALPNFTDPAEAAIAWAAEFKAKQALQIENATMKPKAIFHDAVTASVGTQTMEEVAKSLDIGRNTLFKRLRDEGVLTKDNLPLQYYLDRKWFEVTTYPYVRHDGENYTNSKTVVTGKGLVEINKLLGE